MSLPELQPKAEVRPRLARGGEWKAFVPQTPTGRLCKINPVSRSLGIPINSPILFHFWPASTFAVKFHHQVGKCKLDFDANAALPVQKHPAENITFNQTGVPKFHLFTWIFSGKILIPADFFRSRMLWGLTIELLCGRRWAPRTFCWTGISECSGSEGSGSERFPKWGRHARRSRRRSYRGAPRFLIHTITYLRVVMHSLCRPLQLLACCSIRPDTFGGTISPFCRLLCWQSSKLGRCPTCSE